MKETFAETRNLEKVDLSNFNISNEDYNKHNTFYGTNPNIIIKTGNETFKNDMINDYPNLNIQKKCQ